MSLVINSKRDDGEKEQVELFNLPDSCPRCHCKIHALQITDGFLTDLTGFKGHDYRSYSAVRIESVGRCLSRRTIDSPGIRITSRLIGLGH